ncbi:MAG: 50S ribosomal protein L4, partial [Nitrospirae bacterium]|nr:50S ribosomal protein L4 [Nitrospirota bacterium]
MPEIRMVNIRNQEVGTLSLRDEIFNVPIRPTLLHEVVVMQQNNRRQGSAATKTRGLVSGGGKKPWKQKGTGRARSGSSRSPVWVGGGTVFGPQPRDYGYTMPRKKVRAALFSALSSKVQESQLVVVDALEVSGQKTKEAAKIFRDLGIRERALLVATP